MSTMKYTVLIAEDDALLSDMYAAKFEAEGFVVVRAGNGEEALTLARDKKPHAILLDVMMPKLDGFNALQQLRAEKAFAKTPIIMLTNLAQEEDIKKGKALGANDYFVKANQTPMEIVDKVRALLK